METSVAGPAIQRNHVSLVCVPRRTIGWRASGDQHPVPDLYVSAPARPTGHCVSRQWLNNSRTGVDLLIVPSCLDGSL